MNLSEMEDWDFSKAWIEMSAEDKAALSPEDRKFSVERYRALTSYMNDAARRFKKGNGESYDFDPGPVPDEAGAQTNLIDWSEFVGEPPPQEWVIPHWLGWNPTLLAGKGGIGKSLLIQQILTQLATGTPTWGPAHEPLRVLYWACEDDKTQLWRRQHFICKALKIPFSDLGSMQIDARIGLENTLMETVYGRLMFTPQIEVLRQQLNDLQIDVLALDNIGHTFGGNENARHDVTTFVNRIGALVSGRRFCPVFLGHPSKAPGSEFSGSTAWENSVRMRWYLGDKLPNSKDADDEPPDNDYRVLAKRKNNYTIKDYIGFKFSDGVLVPEQREGGDPGLMDTLRKRKAQSVVLSAMRKLADSKIYGNNQSGRYYLPHLILENKLADGLTKAELGEAMRTLVLAKKIEMSEFGRSAQRHRVFGLKEIESST